MVRLNAVKEAEREPSAAGVRCEVSSSCEERAARSLRIEVLCLRAELKVVFYSRWKGRVSLVWLGGF